MLPPNHAIEFGWIIVCQAVKQTVKEMHGPFQTYQISKRLGWDAPRAGNVVYQALKTLNEQGEPVEVNAGGWWSYTP